MMQGLCLIPIQSQMLYLSQTQRQTLRQLLELRLELVHPSFPNPSKGFEGLQKANEILAKRNATGILVGGVSEEIWHPRRSKKDLAEHKDVDVLVLTPEFKLANDFEEGIDWWLPHSARIKYTRNAITTEETRNYWLNCADFMLRFGVKRTNDIPLRRGLYIPSNDFVVDMRIKEALSKTSASVQLDNEVEDALYNRIRKKIGYEIPKFIERSSIGIMRDNYYGLEVEQFNPEIIAAINTSRGITEKPVKD